MQNTVNESDKISAVFNDKPIQWGLRGDPYLWEEFVITIGSLPLPSTQSQFSEILTATFNNIVGFPISHQKDVFIERFAHGGMSSGYVCIEFWREEAFPMLIDRFLKFKS